jgi:uncharacterized membrane-anchored protein
MQTRHVPQIDLRYWFGIIFASIFGTNLGDLYAHDSGLGIGLGVLLLVALFAAIYAIERQERASHEVYYWCAIIIIRTGATNIADYLAFRRHIPAVPLAAALAALIAVLMLTAGSSSPASANGRSPDPSLQKTHLIYWAAMLAAGVFGTVAGDVCSHHFGQGPSAITLGLVFALLVFFTQARVVTSVPLYWCIVAVARTAGTCMGDWFAENRMLHLGLPLSTLMTGAAFVAILTVWRSAPKASSAQTRSAPR